MNMTRERVRTVDLQGGDIVRRTGDRTLVIQAVSLGRIHYQGEDHWVTRVTAFDVGTFRPVAWLAVPDQTITAIR